MHVRQRLAPMVAVTLIAATCCAIWAVHSAAEDNMQKYHHVKKSPKVDYQGYFDAATPLADSPEGQAAFAACLESYGGRETLDGITGMRLTYRIPGLREDDSSRVVKSFARGRRYKVVSDAQARMIDSRQCFVSNGVSAEEMDGFRYRAELFSYLVLTMPLAAEKENFDAVRFGAGESPELDYLFFTKSDSLMLILGLDRDERLIRTASGILPEEDTDIVYVNEFEDFRPVGEIVLPHKVGHISMGMRLGHLVLDKVDVNPEFKESEFSGKEDEL